MIIFFADIYKLAYVLIFNASHIYQKNRLYPNFSSASILTDDVIDEVKISCIEIFKLISEEDKKI